VRQQALVLLPLLVQAARVAAVRAGRRLLLLLVLVQVLL
jgi:hypothetical protein